MNYIFSYNFVYNDHFKSTNYIEAFCKSLQRINFNGKIIMFTESEQRLCSKFSGLDVKFVSVEEMTNRFQNNINYPLIRGLEDLSIKRLFIKKMYIEENNIKNDDNILFIDSRDSIFQSDPFVNINSSKLTFGEETLPFINNWTTPQFEMYKFDTSLFSSIMDCKGYAVNTGVYIGSVGNYLKLINDVANDISYVKNNVPYVDTKIPVCDQIIINKLLKINKIDYCDVLPHQNKFVINHLLDGTFTYDGKLVYVNNTPVSIVHQYDRNSTMFKLLSDQYVV